MTQQPTKTCPTCNGNKVMQGTCECSNEWRGTQIGEEWNDCQCSPDVPCPTCGGKGVVEG